MVAKWCLGYALRVLLHATNLRHGTDNFTSLPKEGVLRIFYRPLKIPRLRPGLNPRTSVLKASTLPLHHRSRYDVWVTKVWNSPNIHKTHGSLLILQHTLLLRIEWMKDRPIHTAKNKKRDWAGHGWHNCRTVGDTYHQSCTLFPNH